MDNKRLIWIGILGIMCIVLISGCTDNSSTEKNTPTEEINFNSLGWCDPSLTKLQREKIVDEAKGKYLVGTGEVIEIEEDWGGTPIIYIRHCPDTAADVVVFVKEEQKNDTLGIRKGEILRYKGELEGLGNYLRVRDGEIS